MDSAPSCGASLHGNHHSLVQAAQGNENDSRLPDRHSGESRNPGCVWRRWIPRPRTGASLRGNDGGAAFYFHGNDGLNAVAPHPPLVETIIPRQPPHFRAIPILSRSRDKQCPFALPLRHQRAHHLPLAPQARLLPVSSPNRRATLLPLQCSTARSLQPGE